MALENSKNISSQLYCKFTEDLNAQSKTLKNITLIDTDFYSVNRNAVALGG